MNKVYDHFKTGTHSMKTFKFSCFIAVTVAALLVAMPPSLYSETNTDSTYDSGRGTIYLSFPELDGLTIKELINTLGFSHGHASSWFSSGNSSGSFDTLLSSAGNAHEMGKRKTALGYYKKAFLLAAESNNLKDIAVSARGMGDLCEQMGDRNTADILTVISLKCWEKIMCSRDISQAFSAPSKHWFGFVKPDTTPFDWRQYEGVLNNAASVARQRGNYETEARFLQKLVFFKCIRLGQFHLETGLARSSYGTALKNAGHYDDAQKEYKKAMNILGKCDTRFGMAQVGFALAQLYRERGMNKEADDIQNTAEFYSSMGAPGSVEDEHELVVDITPPPSLKNRRRHNAEIVCLPHYGQITDLTFSPSGKYLAVAVQSNGGGIFLWNTGSWKCEYQEALDKTSAKKLSFTNNGRLIVASNKGIHLFQLFEPESGRKGHENTVTVNPLNVLELPAPKNELYPNLLAFGTSIDGKIAATSCYTETGTNPRFFLIDLTTEAYTEYEGIDGSFSSFAFSPDSLTLATVQVSQSPTLWKLRKTQPPTAQKQKNIDLSAHSTGSSESISFTPSGTQLAIGDSNGYVRVHALKTGKIRTFKAHNYTVNSMAFSRDGRTLITGSSDLCVNVWNMKDTPTQRARLFSHGDSVTVVAIADNATMAASGGYDNQVIVWDLLKIKD